MSSSGSDPRRDAMENLENGSWDSVPSQYKNDQSFILEALTKYSKVWNGLTKAQKEVKANSIAGVKHDGFRLFEVSHLYENDIDVVKAAVGNNGAALNFASDRLKDNLEVVKIAVKELWESGVYMSDRIKSDLASMKVLCAIDGNVLKFATDDLKKNSELCHVAVGNTGKALMHCDISIVNTDRSLNVKAVRNYPLAIGSVGKPFAKDKEICYISKSGSSTEAVNAANIPFRIERMMGG